MRQRGRQSREAIGIGPERVAHTLSPPGHLSQVEAETFHEIAASVPPNHFSHADSFLLASFAQLTVLIRSLASDVAKATKETKAGKVKLFLEACKAQSLVATKLRITVQSRITPRTAGRAHEANTPSAYDMMLPEEWQ